ncbi:MAG: O-succinylbenzoate synthase [Streptomycetaceae bacterium]|nr:MAG: O-succinylbenzoate synthase [Streptomycetaceae bacterium]
MLDSILGSLKVVALATKTDFRSITSREVALFEGPMGWGEFSPFLEYSYEESVPWLVSAAEAAFAHPPTLIRKRIEINATLPAIDDPIEIAEILASFNGAKVVKIKVGASLESDLARIACVRELLPDAKIRIDVNGLWSVDQAQSFLDQVGEIEYVEQPCFTIEELRELKLRTSVKIAGDEIIRKAKDPFSIDLDGAIDILMLKVAPLGGITRAMKLAQHHGLPIAVSSALESAVGISHGIKLAAALPRLDFACGLGTGSLLAVDVTQLLIIDGTIAVSDATPDSSALGKYAVSNERLNWWKNRIRMTWSAGAENIVHENGWSL